MNRNSCQKRNARVIARDSHHKRPTNEGVVMLTKAADLKVQEKCTEIAEALANQAIKGNASSTRLLVDLADGPERVKDVETVEKVLSVVEAWTKELKGSDKPGEMPAALVAPQDAFACIHEAADSAYLN